MFEIVKRITKNVRGLDKANILKQSLDNSQIQQDIINLNTESQLYDKGIDADGNSLGEYSRATIYGTSAYEGKISKGQPYDRVTLKDTGAFYESFSMKLTNDGFIISANTIKGGGSIELSSSIPSTKGKKYTVNIDGGDLQEKYGHIIGLTSESLSEVRGWIKPIFIDKTLKQIFK